MLSSIKKTFDFIFLWIHKPLWLASAIYIIYWLVLLGYGVIGVATPPGLAALGFLAIVFLLFVPFYFHFLKWRRKLKDTKRRKEDKVFNIEN